MAVYYPQCHAAVSLVLDGLSGSDLDPIEVRARVRSCSVNLNSYKDADTFEIEFSVKDIGVSPEQIRSAGVSIYMFGTPELTSDYDSYINDTNLLITGLADDCSYSEADNTFRLSGRDYTCLLADRQWDPRKRVPIGKRLDKWVQDMVNEAIPLAEIKQDKNTYFRGLIVEYQAAGSPPSASGHFYKTKKRGQCVKEGKSYWDIIYMMCVSLGLVCYVKGNKVIITDPQSWSTLNAGKERKVAYGVDLASLEIERHLGKERVPQVVATSWDPTTRKNIQVTWPATRDKQVTGVGTKRDEFEYITPATGVADFQTLKKFAIAYYNHRANSEARVKFSTKDLEDLEGTSLLTLRAGDPITIQFDPYNYEVLSTLTPSQRAKYLSELEGYDADVAQVIADHFDRFNTFREPFYTKSVNVNWNVDEGIAIDVEAMHYVSIARDGHVT